MANVFDRSKRLGSFRLDLEEEYFETEDDVPVEPLDASTELAEQRETAQGTSREPLCQQGLRHVAVNFTCCTAAHVHV